MFRSAPWISIFIYWLEPSSHIPKFPSLRMSTCQVTMMILDHRGPSNARNTHTHNQTLQNQLAAGEDFVHRAKWVCSIRILPIPTLSIWNQLIIPFVRPTARWAACCMPVPRVSPSGHTHFPCAVIARLLFMRHCGGKCNTMSPWHVLLLQHVTICDILNTFCRKQVAHLYSSLVEFNTIQQSSHIHALDLDSAW